MTPTIAGIVAAAIALVALVLVGAFVAALIVGVRILNEVLRDMKENR